MGKQERTHLVIQRAQFSIYLLRSCSHIPYVLCPFSRLSLIFHTVCIRALPANGSKVAHFHCFTRRYISFPVSNIYSFFHWPSYTLSPSTECCSIYISPISMSGCVFMCIIACCVLYISFAVRNTVSNNSQWDCSRGALTRPKCLALH